MLVQIAAPQLHGAVTELGHSGAGTSSVAVGRVIEPTATRR